MSDVLGLQTPLDPASLGCFEKREYVFNQNTLYRYDQIFTNLCHVGLATIEITKAFTCGDAALGIYTVDRVNGKYINGALYGLCFLGQHNYIVGSNTTYIFGSYAAADTGKTDLNRPSTWFVHVGGDGEKSVNFYQYDGYYFGLTALNPDRITAFGEILLTLYMLG